ncbi:MAG: DUF368 domain-containing protein [Bacilli bacterium]|nr:DUF368 domain-containing protein [Bacilli bacterium]
MKAKEWFSDFARGSALGTGMLPGVSAGTVGIIVNVYDKMINAINGLLKPKTFWKSLLTLLPIGIGCVLATLIILLFWSAVAYPRFPFIVIAALAGFVLGAMPVLTAELNEGKLSWADYLRILSGFIVAASIGIVAYLAAAHIIPFDMDFAEEIDAPFQSPWIFALVGFAGFLSAISCLVPGISGAMLLFILGLYNPIVDMFISRYNGAGELIHASIFRDTSKLGGGALITLCLLAGMLIGFFIVSKLMETLLKKHRHGTFTVIIGFVLGSVVSMFLNNDMYSVYKTYPTNAWWQYVFGGVACVGVGLATFFLIRSRQRAQKELLAAKTEEAPESTEE